MVFVELNRYFYPVDKKEDLDVEVRHFWGKQLGEWLDWDGLLKKKRVVLLAEASSGKTEEFKNCCKKLISQNKKAFYITIEELVDEEFARSLDSAAAIIFENWVKGFEEGFFFLDSVDEARLNRKRFDFALKKLSKKIYYALDRSRIFISCRVSDWMGKGDEEIIKSFLPVPIPNDPLTENETPDPETELLSPIFENRRNTDSKKDNEEKPEEDVIVVRLAPLDAEQQKKLAYESGIKNVSDFHDSVWQHGLENYADRPGDLIDLAEYWKSNQKFGTLSQMMEHGVNKKLAERNPYRADNDTLTDKKAREGVERIAAALTFGKTFTIRAPGQEADPELAVGAIEPKKILNDDWTDAERNALLRRGIFAPSTYGRVRFHHRSAQEYLTACWMNRLMENESAKSELFKLIFSEVYGVKTVIPSLRPATAWLSTLRSDVRDEVLKRDPLILIQHGDPGVLPLETKKKLLHIYAEKFATGDIANDSLDHRALWMFADPDLAETINEIWHSCPHYDFRGDLLRLIREGEIRGCSDIISKVALDQAENTFKRIVAVQALVKIKCGTVLLRVTANLVREAPQINAGLASRLSCELFPDFLNLDQLILLIEETRPPAEGSSSGFGYALEELWGKCPEIWREKFVAKISELALSKPFVDYRFISKKFGFLAKHFEPIARQLISVLGDREPTTGLVSLLMAMERVDNYYAIHEDEPSLANTVQSHPKLNRALFWADVEENRKNSDNKKRPWAYWEIFFGNHDLWNFGTPDLRWLYNDLDCLENIEDKRIILSAILKILKSDGSLDAEKSNISERIKLFPQLIQDLEDFLRPRIEQDWERERRLRQEKNIIEREAKDKQKKESWVKFKNEVVGNPLLLSSFDKSFWCIDNLTRWLRFETNQGPEKAPRQWQQLLKAFSVEVAKAYRDAMKKLWRQTKPKRDGGRFANLYSYAGIGIEADETPHWAAFISKEEAKIAAQHGCLSEQGYPEWLDQLLDIHPDVVLPVVRNAFRYEWKSKHDGTGYLLYRYGNETFPIHPQIAPSIFEIIIRTDPFSAIRLNYGIQILQRMDLSEKQIKRLEKLAISKFSHYIKSGEHKSAVQYLPLMFRVSPKSAIKNLKNCLESAKVEEQKTLALKFFASFNKERGSIKDGFNDLPLTVLKEMILTAYRYIKRNEDVIHDGVYEPNLRDDAQSGRDNFLSALINTKGFEAYKAMRELAEMPEMKESAHRFRRLARGMAERDSEFSAWTEDETVKFEKTHIAPIKTGRDLFKVVMAVLGDIRSHLEKSDASSKKLLSILKEIKKGDEESIQNWLAEQLELRSRDRYHIHREPEVANKNKPDIIISGATVKVELVIEVKQADSWSPNDLKKALTRQLAEDYLKPRSRRYGILFLTDHGRRKWYYPQTKKRLSFDALLEFLSGIAVTTATSSTGEVQISVFGVDAK